MVPPIQKRITFSVLIVLVQCLVLSAFNAHRASTAREPLQMISNLLNTGPSQSNSLPRDVKEAVQSCREATQSALQKRVSRMDVEFPVGTKFNVEKGGGKRKSGDTPSREELDKSDRELARLFVDMFQPVGGERISVVFNDVFLADKARGKWKGDPTASSRIVSMDRRKSAIGKKKKKSVRGFAAKLAEEVGDTQDGGPFKLPDDTEVAMFVAPGPKELIIIEKICKEVGMETLIILLNARLPTISNFGTASAKEFFEKEFEPVFSLTAASQEAAPGCLLYRSYPGDWALARKPTVGAPKTILTQPVRPSPEESSEAFGNIEMSDVEKGVESVVENVSNWFR